MHFRSGPRFKPPPPLGSLYVGPPVRMTKYEYYNLMHYLIISINKKYAQSNSETNTNTNKSKTEGFIYQGRHFIHFENFHFFFL